MKRQAGIGNCSAETLGGVTTICVDKTGTLTQGKMQVTDVIGEESSLAMQTILANDLDDPIVIAASEWGRNIREVDLEAYRRLDSIPFSSENKYFASLHRFSNQENTLFVNGAPEVLIDKSVLDDGEKKLLFDQINNLTGRGKRVLGFARKTIPLDIINIENTEIIRNLEWQGLIAFSDPVRLDVKDALQLTKEAGIRLVVITGDYSKTAVAILNNIGIIPNEEDIILGDELETMSDDELVRRLFANRDIKLFARTKPEQKMKIVQALKGNNEVVAMMGDGVNDAPALIAADIGIVVGDATDVAKESADLVLLDSSFKTIVFAVEEGRGIFDNLRKMILYLMCDAFVGIIVVLIALVSKLPLPITAAQILWVNLVSDGFPSLALTVEPKVPGIMKRPPRAHDEHLVTSWVKKLILLVSLFGGVIAFALFYFAYKNTGDIVFARSVTFAAVGVNSLIYVFSTKTLREPFWKSNIFNNNWLLLAVLGGFVIQFAPFVIPGLKDIFGVVSIGNYWFGAFGGAIVLFIIVEISKWFMRHNLSASKSLQS